MTRAGDDAASEDDAVCEAESGGVGQSGSSDEVGARPLAAPRLEVPPPAYGGEWRQMSQPFDAGVSIDASEADLPVDAPDLEPDFAGSDANLGIDVATAPELEDAELGAVLEALLLVVDTPVTVEALAAATEQPA